jgi:hypothetical protein
MGNFDTDLSVVGGGPACVPRLRRRARDQSSSFRKRFYYRWNCQHGDEALRDRQQAAEAQTHGPTSDEAFKLSWTKLVGTQLVRAYIDRADTSIDWLKSLGIEFVEPATYFPGATSPGISSTRVQEGLFLRRPAP